MCSDFFSGNSQPWLKEEEELSAVPLLFLSALGVSTRCHHKFSDHGFLIATGWGESISQLYNMI